MGGGIPNHPNTSQTRLFKNLWTPMSFFGGSPIFGNQWRNGACIPPFSGAPPVGSTALVDRGPEPRG
jgi:hypothetical protein